MSVSACCAATTDEQSGGEVSRMAWSQACDAAVLGGLYPSAHCRYKFLCWHTRLLAR